MKKYLITGLVLSLFALICGALLSLVNYVTAPKILADNQAKINNSIAEILGEDSVTAEEFATEFDVQTIVGTDNKWKATSVKIKSAYKANVNDTEYVFYLIDTKGFASTIQIMIGVDENNKIAGSSVISQSETKGNVSKWDFNMVGESTVDSIDMLSGSTFSSMAVKRAYQTALAAALVDLD